MAGNMRFWRSAADPAGVPCCRYLLEFLVDHLQSIFTGFTNAGEKQTAREPPSSEVSQQRLLQAGVIFASGGTPPELGTAGTGARRGSRWSRRIDHPFAAFDQALAFLIISSRTCTGRQVR